MEIIIKAEREGREGGRKGGREGRGVRDQL